MVALNDDPQYAKNGFASNLTITAIADQVMSTMPLAFVTGALESSLESNNITVLSSEADLITSEAGVEIGVIETEQPMTTASGTKVTVHSKYLVFQSGGKLVMVQLATEKQFADDLGGIVDEIAQTIELLKP